MDLAAKAHAFVADVDAPELDPADRHHLERALRLRVGDEITVADGAGRWRHCRFGPVLEPTDGVVADPDPHPAITVAFAPVKGARPEWVVQKLTEIGVDRIIPFLGDRSVVQWDEAKVTRQHERLETIVREAAMQSRRSRLPVVEALTTFDALAPRDGAVIAAPDGHPPTIAGSLVLVGPEGGWSDRERAFGLSAICLATNVLRAETAAIAAATTLCGLRAKLVRPVDEHRG